MFLARLVIGLGVNVMSISAFQRKVSSVYTSIAGMTEAVRNFSFVSQCNGLCNVFTVGLRSRLCRFVAAGTPTIVADLW